MKNYITPGFIRIVTAAGGTRSCRPLAMNLRTLERALITLGITMSAAVLGVLAYREIGSRTAIRSFEAAASCGGGIEAPDRVLEVAGAEPDYCLWSARRSGGYSGSLAGEFARGVAILRIPKRGVEVAVFGGTAE